MEGGREPVKDSWPRRARAATQRAGPFAARGRCYSERAVRVRKGENRGGSTSLCG